MSQQQPERRQEGQNAEPIKYGDVFPVVGELASKTVAPRDAAMMQTAENAVFGQTQKGGPAATMQSAATANERAGFVGHLDASDVAKQQGVTVAETEVPGACIITESVGEQVYSPFNANYCNDIVNNQSNQKLKLKLIVEAPCYILYSF